jgi:broad specificity phosphatase PhoE
VLTLLLTRHGHTDRSEPDRYLGQRVDAQLTERGRADAQALGERLAEVRLDRVVSSPLPRAVDTAQLITGGRTSVETDRRLAEMDYGDWEGMTVDEVQQLRADEYSAYDADPAGYQIPGGESGRLLAERLTTLLDDVVGWWRAQPAEVEHNVLLVGHASVNRALLAVSLDVPLRDFRRRFAQDWANLTVLRWSEPEAGPMLLLANDMGHVRGGAGATWG